MNGQQNTGWATPGIGGNPDETGPVREDGVNRIGSKLVTQGGRRKPDVQWSIKRRV